jgi:hypothetical protein
MIIGSFYWLKSTITQTNILIDAPPWNPTNQQFFGHQDIPRVHPVSILVDMGYCSPDAIYCPISRANHSPFTPPKPDLGPDN